jgi:hypothetical protein
MKKLLLLAMVLGLLVLLVSGCAHTRGGRSYWINEDGNQVPSEQLQNKILECRGPAWAKEGVTDKESEKDHQICWDAERARRSRADSWRIWSSTVSGILDIASKNLCERCMKAKGYSPVEQRRDIDSCMKDKGYTWVETKDKEERK